MIVHPQPDVLIRRDAEVGEGPVFDPRTGRLLWVDLTAGVMFEDDPASGWSQQRTIRSMLGAVAPLAKGTGFAVAAEHGFGYLDTMFQMVDPTLAGTGLRMNDAKVDSRGRMWAGSTHPDFIPGLGSLHSWEGGTSARVASGFVLPNGLGWTHTDDRMYLADSFAHQLLAARFDPDDGLIGAFEPIVDFGNLIPDGLAVDVEGGVWIAFWGAGEVRRLTATGEVSAAIPMPVSQPSSCAFGRDGTLVITSARSGLPTAALEREPLAGSVFAINVGVEGVPVTPFGGSA